jgi:type IV secretion system protein VirD4
VNDKNEFLREKPAGVSGEQRLSFLFKMITIVIIFIGIQAAVQSFARGVGYDPRWVGEPAQLVTVGGKQIRIYSFWKLFYWTLMYYKRLDIHPLLFASWKITGYTSMTAIAFYLLLEFVLVRNRRQNIFGTARWASRKDLEKAGILRTKGGMILGQLAEAKLDCKYDASKDSVVMSLLKPAQKIIQSGIYNTLLSAPTRSGKGVSCVIPTLLAYPGSMIILDFKGENFNLTSGFRAKFGKVYRWEPAGGAGHHFNPMMEIRSGENAFSDANLIADILTTPASGANSGNASSDHFISGAKDFLTAVILHCLCSPEWKNKSLPGCREFLASGELAELYDRMIEGEHGDPVIHQSIVEGATAQKNRPEDEGGSMISTVNNALAVFADTKIKRNTSASEFYIDEFEETKVPISLYLTIQYSDVQRISALIRMFVILLSRRFTGGETQATNRKFKIPLLFVLDEFDKLGKMDELEMNMGIHNGFGIHYFLIFQSLNQLNKLYGKDHAFLAHCRNSIFYAPGAGELESAELISKICGRESISRANISYSGTRGALGFNSSSLSSQDQERNLINADELIKLPLDRCILICQGMPPYIGKKNVYYQDKVFAERLCGPAFTSREEALALAKTTIAKIAGRRWFDFKSERPREVDMSDEEAGALFEKLEGMPDGEYPEETEESRTRENETPETDVEERGGENKLPNIM